MVMPVGHWDDGVRTGQMRVRRGWWGKMILQVEVEQMYHEPPGLDGFLNLAMTTRKKWRDAKPDDFSLNHVALNNHELFSRK